MGKNVGGIRGGRSLAEDDLVFRACDWLLMTYDTPIRIQNGSVSRRAIVWETYWSRSLEEEVRDLKVLIVAFPSHKFMKPKFQEGL